VIVVSDTSPLRALQVLTLVPVLEYLYQQVIVPPAVKRELDVDVAGLGGFPFERYPFIRIATPSASSRLSDLRRDVDEGEAEAIALAIELRAPLLLVDDLDGREIARRLGLRTRGVLGVLVQAKESRLCGALWPLIQRLQAEMDFHLSDAIVDVILEQAGEKRG
jgi:hypothetical protein